MKLAAKLIAALLVGVTLTLAIDAYFSIQREIQLYKADMERDAFVLGRALKGLVADRWQAGEGERAMRLVWDANEGEQRVSVRWVWLDAAPGTPYSPHVARKKLEPVAQGQELSLLIRDPEGEERLFAYVPVQAQGRTGALELSESLSELADYSRASFERTLLLMGVLVLGSGLLVVLLGIKLVGQPLTSLLEKTRKMGGGDLTGPLHLRGHDELDDLAVALNTTCDRLAESRERIRGETVARIAALEQLRHADRLKTVGKLTSGIAHELGTPLNVVAGRAGLIASGELSEPEVVESANIIKAQSERITGIVRQLLDFARRGRPQRTPADLRQIVRRTIDLLGSLGSENRVTLSLAGDKTPLMANVDAEQMQQVMTNLIINAIHAMPDGGSVEVDICRELVAPPAGIEASQREYFRVDVQDHGEGIPEENMQSLFEPFFTTKGAGEGTGLGLSIAHGIVSEHGGWIDVTSEPGKGSCFSVYLPQEVAQCAEQS